MEDFKIIFYILVAIAWVVYKNYQKIKENRPQTRTVFPAESTAKKFDDTYKKAIEERKKTSADSQIKKRVPIQKIKSKPAYELQQEAINTEAAAVSAYFKEEIDQLSGASKVKDVKQESKSIINGWHFNPADINIKQAFIYSVILQRPAY